MTKMDQQSRGSGYCHPLQVPVGNNLGILNFVWKVPGYVDQTLNHQMIAKLNKVQNIYFTCLIKIDFLDKYIHLALRVSQNNKAVLQNMFLTLVHDESAPTPKAEAEIDEHVVMCLLDMVDPNIIVDTRKLNSKPGSSKFDTFCLELSKYLEKVGPAVQERRHEETVHARCDINQSPEGSDFIPS